jgi:hypothetical protein
MAPESMAASPRRLLVSHSGSPSRYMGHPCQGANLPRANRYEKDCIIVGEYVFHPVRDYTQCTLLDLEVFVLSKMYMSTISANQISFLDYFDMILLTYNGGPESPALTTGFST